MNCLTDYIGIRVCSTDTSPESGLFINPLPGLSLESIDKIADKDQITYRGVWADAQEEAYQRFVIDFFDALMGCFKVQPYIDYEAILCANKKILSVAWRYLLGNQLMMYRLYTNRLNYFTTIAKEDAAELLTHYQVQYEQALSKAVKLIDVSHCRLLECGGNPEYVTWLP